jgi:hypothetical protein
MYFNPAPRIGNTIRKKYMDSKFILYLCCALGAKPVFLHRDVEKAKIELHSYLSEATLPLIGKKRHRLPSFLLHSLFRWSFNSFDLSLSPGFKVFPLQVTVNGNGCPLASGKV